MSGPMRFVYGLMWFHAGSQWVALLALVTISDRDPHSLARLIAFVACAAIHFAGNLAGALGRLLLQAYHDELLKPRAFDGRRVLMQEAEMESHEEIRSCAGRWLKADLVVLFGAHSIFFFGFLAICIMRLDPLWFGFGMLFFSAGTYMTISVYEDRLVRARERERRALLDELFAATEQDW